ncbi:MAG: hypothetical protein R8K20_02260 [Gallionellaceae bacterium]
MRLSNLLIIALLTSTPAAAVSWDNLGDGVCAALCGESDWSTDSGGYSGRSWISEEEIAERQERIRQWEEYRTKLAARTAAQKEFRNYIRSKRKILRKLWRTGPQVSIPMREAIERRSSVVAILGVVANPNIDTIANSGIDLARPVSIGDRTRFSLDGLRKFSAIVEHLSTSNGASNELETFMFQEGAAHMSGHASRIAVYVSPSSQDMPNLGSGESFQAAWAEIEKSQQKIRTSEDRRLDWANEAIHEKADIDKLDIRIRKASGNAKKRLEKKRAEKVKKVSALREKFNAAIQAEEIQTTAVATQMKKIRKFPKFGSTQ